MDEAKVDRVERKLGRLKEAKSKPAAAVVRETEEEEEVDNVERSEERLSASSSSNSSIDMESLVEECFEENALDSCYEDTVSFLNLLNNTDPVFELTFEEEFKIHELVVRKESLCDTTFGLLLQIPQISWLFKQFLYGPHPRSLPGRPVWQWLCSKGTSMVRKVIVNSLEEGGQVRACLDMFDEYKHVEETAKKETFQFSLRVLHICSRAFLRVHCDKETWREQAKATGLISQGMLDAICDKYPSDRSSVDPLKVPLFSSPWAENLSSEQFFATTVEELGRVVGSDQGLATLYTTLILATPGAHLSHTTKGDPMLKRVQNEMTLLIFRFLKKKLQSSEEAKSRTTLLLKLVGDLHTSHDILARAYPM